MCTYLYRCLRYTCVSAFGYLQTDGDYKVPWMCYLPENCWKSRSNAPLLTELCNWTEEVARQMNFRLTIIKNNFENTFLLKGDADPPQLLFIPSQNWSPIAKPFESIKPQGMLNTASCWEPRIFSISQCAVTKEVKYSATGPAAGQERPTEKLMWITVVVGLPRSQFKASPCPQTAGSHEGFQELCPQGRRTLRAYRKRQQAQAEPAGVGKRVDKDFST